MCRLPPLALYLLEILLTRASPLQVRLTDTGALLPPQEEIALFSRHPEVTEYRVLRWVARERRARREAKSSSSLLFHFPLPHDEVDLVLEKSSIAAPDLESRSQNKSSAETESWVPTDCFYSGGSSASWAVMSTCDGLSGLLLHGGKTYRVEELPPPPQQQSQSRPYRGPDSPLLVVFPISSPFTSASDDGDLTKKWGDSRSKTPINAVVEEPIHVLGHRKTRAARAGKAAQDYTMELAVYIDDPLVYHVKKRYPSADAKKKAKEIVMTLLTVVGQIFSDPSLGDVSLKILVKKVKILGPGTVNEAAGDGNNYLSNFCMWQAEKNDKRGARIWDHALLLTGLDLYSVHPRNRATTGMSFIGGMCALTHSCSIVEGTKFTSAFTIAHEMGHSMNLVHDGDGPAAACSRTGYLMATSLNDGGHTWSSCSRKQLRAFLHTHGTCLTEEDIAGKRTHLISTKELPGRKIDADQQCHYMFGEGWRHATDHHLDVCQEIWCYKRLRLKSPGVSALDGTSCGLNKMCLKGSCKTLEAAKKYLSRKSKKTQPEKRKKKTTKKVAKKLMKKMKKSLSRNENKKDEVKEKVKSRSDEKEGNKKGNARKDGNVTRKENTKKNQTSGKYMKLLTKMMRQVKKLMKNMKGTQKEAKSNAKAKTMYKEEKAKQEDGIREATSNKTGKADENKQGNSRDDEDEKTRNKKKLRRLSKQQLKKRWNALNKPGQEKQLPKIRKIESPTHIVIKERLNYVKGKGWKVNILKIRKSKKLAKKKVNVKKYIIKCDKRQTRCKISAKKTQHRSRMTVRPSKLQKNRKLTRRLKSKSLPLNSPKKTKKSGLRNSRRIPSIKALTSDQCQPRRIKYVPGKGWLLKVSHACLKSNKNKNEEE